MASIVLYILKKRPLFLMNSSSDNKKRLITEEEVIVVFGHCLRFRSSEHIQTISSGEWVLFLGSNQTPYELSTKKPSNCGENSIDLNLNFGPFYAIDCQ